MPERSSKRKRKPGQGPEDVNQMAAGILAAIPGALPDDPEEEPATEPKKNPAAVQLGRLGGLKGGKARAAALSKKQRAEIAKVAATARWKKS